MTRLRSKMEKYAEKYFSDNGFEFKLKEERFYTEYVVKKHGVCMKWCAAKNEHRYKYVMDDFERVWDIMCQYHRINTVKEEMDKNMVNQFPSKEKLIELRKKFSVGTKIRLLYMDDIQAVPSGTIGSVANVDDMGTIHMVWNNGSTLGLIPEKDRFELL